jgi:hypothetical protein
LDELTAADDGGIGALELLDGDVEISGFDDEIEEAEEDFEGGDPSKDTFLARVSQGRRARPLPDVSKLLG